MEQQCVSVVKARLVARLSVQTTVFAAAYPLHVANGDHSQPVQNLTVSQTISDIDLDAKSGTLVSRLRLDSMKDIDFDPLLRKYIAGYSLQNQLASLHRSKILQFDSKSDLMMSIRISAESQKPYINSRDVDGRPDQEVCCSIPESDS
ncbi:hypothetical protein L6452_09032 [Arctium lappa]|uniref:Uncharacterized protein n=1 Tax=Arctium lappa TaxID=4217 RepID=A0ACB9DJD4_ARCLA|nr:hypothetical protein L6452_09032 [Arctium lappa]